MNLEGTIKEIFETKEFGSNGFTKREMVLTTGDKYPQPILIEFTKARCSLLDNYAVGQKVNISINILGKEWVSPQGDIKYFTSINGWRIEAVGTSETPLDNMPDKIYNKAINDDEPDDLPF